MSEHTFETYFEKIRAASATDGALSKLDMYRNLEDGWQGPDSLAPSRRAFVEAETFVEKLVEAVGNTRGFLVGIDSDGEIVFSWDNDEVVGNLAIPGNNNYFYFIKSRRDSSVASGGASISEPLSPDLSNILSWN